MSSQPCQCPTDICPIHHPEEYNAVMAVNDAVNDLEAKLALAKEALEFYASGKHIEIDDAGVIQHEMGATAREALEKLK